MKGFYFNRINTWAIWFSRKALMSKWYVQIGPFIIGEYREKFKEQFRKIKPAKGER